MPQTSQGKVFGAQSRARGAIKIGIRTVHRRHSVIVHVLISLINKDIECARGVNEFGHQRLWPVVSLSLCSSTCNQACAFCFVSKVSRSCIPVSIFFRTTDTTVQTHSRAPPPAIHSAAVSPLPRSISPPSGKTPAEEEKWEKPSPLFRPSFSLLSALATRGGGKGGEENSTSD